MIRSRSGETWPQRRIGWPACSKSVAWACIVSTSWPAVRLALVVASGESSRVPEPESCELTGLPLVRLRFDRVGCADIIRLALDCAQGRVIEIAGPITR